MLERVLTGALAAATPALLGTALAGAAAGPRFDLLHGGGAWAYLGTWAAGTAVLAAVPDAVLRWRLAAATGALLMLAGALLVLARGAGIAAPMAAALVLCATACGALVRAISRARVGRHKEPGARRRNVARAGATAPAGTVGADLLVARARRAADPALAWLCCTGACIATFAVAHAGTTPAARAAGGLALLATVLLLVPAAAMREWYPRAAVLTAALAAALLAALAVRAGLVTLAACAVAALAVAAGALLRRRDRHVATRHDRSSAPATSPVLADPESPR